MTVILALETDDGVWFGADAWIGDGHTVERVATPKVHRLGPLVIGYAGATGHAQAVLDHLEMAPKPRKGTTDAWIRKAFRLAAKRALDDLPGDDELQAIFLVICDGRAWSIDPSLAVTRSAHGYQAIGAGAAVALGALHATRGRRDHEVRVRTALEAAAAHADGVAPPFHVELVR